MPAKNRQETPAGSSGVCLPPPTTWHDTPCEWPLRGQHQHAALRRANSTPASPSGAPPLAPSPPAAAAAQGFLAELELAVRQRQRLSQQREAQQRWAAEAQRLLQQRGSPREHGDGARRGTPSPPLGGSAAAALAAAHRLEADEHWRAAQARRRQHDRDVRLAQHEGPAADAGRQLASLRQLSAHLSHLEQQLALTTQLAARKMAQARAQAQRRAQRQAGGVSPPAAALQRQHSAPAATPSQLLDMLSSWGGGAAGPQAPHAEPSRSPPCLPAQAAQQPWAQRVHHSASGTSHPERSSQLLLEVVGDLSILNSSAADCLPAGLGQLQAPPARAAPAAAEDSQSNESCRLALPLCASLDSAAQLPGLLGGEAGADAGLPPLQRQHAPAAPPPSSPTPSLLPSPGGRLHARGAPEPQPFLPAEAAPPPEACCLPHAQLEGLCLPSPGCLPELAAGDDDFLSWLLD